MQEVRNNQVRGRVDGLAIFRTVEKKYSRKYRNFQTSKCPKYRERSQHRIKRGKLRVSV